MTVPKYRFIEIEGRIAAMGPGLLGYTVRRLLWAVPVLFVISVDRVLHAAARAWRPGRRDPRPALPGGAGAAPAQEVRLRRAHPRPVHQVHAEPGQRRPRRLDPAPGLHGQRGHHPEDLGLDPARRHRARDLVHAGHPGGRLRCPRAGDVPRPADHLVLAGDRCNPGVRRGAGRSCGCSRSSSTWSAWAGAGSGA